MNTGRAIHGSLSLYDVMQWEALPDDVRQLADRIYGRSDVVGPDEALRDAYEAGFEDGAEACEIERPTVSDHDFKNYLKTLKSRSAI